MPVQARHTFVVYVLHEEAKVIAQERQADSLSQQRYYVFAIQYWLVCIMYCLLRIIFDIHVERLFKI